jgi:hypothetical protein
VGGWRNIIYAGKFTLETGCGGNTRKIRRPAGTGIAFGGRYLALTFSTGQIPICVWAAIACGCHMYTINFIRKRAPEERTSNRDKLDMNTTQYVTEILESHLVPFIYWRNTRPTVRTSDKTEIKLR